MTGSPSLLRRPVPRFVRRADLALFVSALLFSAGCAPRSRPVPPVEGGGDALVGVASWYGGRFNGRRTANGETYDMNALTAAHRTLPFGTIVDVTNLENGKTVRLRINDRGPFVRGRIIDTSRRAAEELGFLIDGTARVRLRIVAPD